MIKERDDSPTPNSYAPRKRAAQETAAAKRARAVLDGGAPPADLSPATLPLGIVAAVLILAMLAMATYQLSWPAVPLQLAPTIAPTSPMRGVLSAPAPVPAPIPTITTIPAYAAPGGVMLGQIEIDRHITPVAHYGETWVQADVAGSGLVWLRAADLPGVAMIGPDLAPKPPQTGRGMAPAPPVAQPEVVNDWYTDIATPPPEFVEALIGDDPNALACGGSPWCGGLTNAEAQAALDARGRKVT